jgi:hypothetical protein
VKLPNRPIELHENPFNGATVTDGQTDVAKLVSAVLQLLDANASKNHENRSFRRPSQSKESESIPGPTEHEIRVLATKRRWSVN